jgi:hypothetical protein
VFFFVQTHTQNKTRKKGTVLTDIYIDLNTERNILTLFEKKRKIFYLVDKREEVFNDGDE